MVNPTVVAAGIQTAGNLVSSLFGGDGPGPREQAFYQREHQQQLDWKRPSWIVHGAKQAGIHPLSVLGSPVSGPSAAPLFPEDPNSRAADAMQAAGSGIASAVRAYGNRDDELIAKKSALLGLENQELQNQRLRSEIQLMSSPGRGPGISAGGVKLVDKLDTVNNGGMNPGQRAAGQLFEYPGIGPVRHMSDEAAEATEDDILAKAMFSVLYTAPDLAKNFLVKGGRKIRQTYPGLARQFDKLMAR